MKRPALVVFDLAGTTVEDPGMVNLCLRDALAAAGVEPTLAEVDAVMGIPKPEAIRRLVDAAGKADELGDRQGAIYEDFVARMSRYYREDPGVREIEGVSALFAKLRAVGIKVAVDTGFSRPITRIILDRLGWEARGLIDGSVTSDEVAEGRPAPDMVVRLMELLEVSDPASVAKVGDAPADLEKGQRAGCGWVIGVTEGTHTRKQLEGWPHTQLVGTVRDLEALFGL